MFQNSGVENIKVTAIDEDGHSSLLTTTTVNVTAWALERQSVTDLVYSGTPGNDEVSFEITDGVNTIIIRESMLNGAAADNIYVVTGVTGHLHAYGGGGDDLLDASQMTSGVYLDGGAGNNTLYGGNGGDTFVRGSDGAEGQDGSNVIVAGNGNNTIYGNGLTAVNGEIGGITLFSVDREMILFTAIILPVMGRRVAITSS